MYYENYRRRLRREELRKKAREAKSSSRCVDADKCGNDCDGKNGSGGKEAVSEGIPQVTANMSMDSVDSTVDLSYASADSSTLQDTDTSNSSSAASMADEVEEDVDAQRQQQQQRRRLIAAAAAAAPPSAASHATTTSTHTHVTTTSAFQAWSVDGRGKRAAAAMASAPASAPTLASTTATHIHTNRQQQQQQQQQRRSGKRLICLISNGVADRVQAHRQLHALNILNVRRTPYEVVDGMDPAQRQRRDELFRISDIRGNYPQFFVERQVDNGYGGTNARVEFWGSYERMEQLNEVDSLPPDVLLANPDVETWGRVFGDCY